MILYIHHFQAIGNRLWGFIRIVRMRITHTGVLISVYPHVSNVILTSHNYESDRNTQNHLGLSNHGTTAHIYMPTDVSNNVHAQSKD